MGISPSFHKIVNTREESLSSLERAQLAKKIASLSTVSDSKKSWQDCNLFGYCLRTRQRMLRIEKGDKPKLLPSPRTLLVHAADSDILMFPFWLQQSPNVSDLDMVVQILHDPRAIQFSKITEQVLCNLPLLNAFFYSAHFSDVRIYVVQQLLIPHLCKTTSPTNLCFYH
ncbi:hypothetical protein TNCV_1822121 [Trichonephila clavipes]|nr:hypothetical protein TNCV_1822121 [Trichonephila clavipes]